MKGATLLGVILVAAAGLFFAWSFSYGGMAGFVPLVLSLPTLLLAALCLAGERYPRIISAFEVSLEDVLSSATGAEEEGAKAQEATQGPKAGEFAVIVRMFIWFAVFGVLVLITGFYVSTFLFAVFFTHYQGNIAWPGTVFITALALGFFYFIFEETLAVDLFSGIIFGAFVPPL